MQYRYHHLLPAAAAAVAIFLSMPAHAGVSAEEAAKLGVTGTPLTPTGAERAGNADGSIPEWTGGITEAPAGFVAGSGNYVDPYASDKVLFTITAQNYKQYVDKLTPGQIAMLEKNPETYRLDIYPTRRSYSAPQHIYERSIKNATEVSLDKGGYDPDDKYFGGTCFPIPKTGIEARLNAVWWRCQYVTGGERRWYNASVMDPNGGWETAHIEEWHGYPQYAPGAAWGSVLPEYQVLQIVQAPPRLAGQAILLISDVNYARQGGKEKIWSYNPGQRRVRRAPQISYDYPKSGSNGLMAVDQAYCSVHGNADRYDWTLKGKKELYIPYNNYKLSDRSIKESDVMKPGNINQDMVRYELHRVWVVEGKQKPDYHMAYDKRVLYLDEDSWLAATADIYDDKDTLWKLEECATINYYDYGVFSSNLEMKYELRSEGYVVLGLDVARPSTPRQFNIDIPANTFTIGNLKGEGIR
ncbi:MAG: DUF1329 domain-containing protein [Parvibaculum sp.]|nr:DUF1329 domain-containing protein [Parvibaculum sp.]